MSRPSPLLFKSGYKHVVAADYSLQLSFVRPRAEAELPLSRLTRGGVATFFAGYAWDGASGPAIDTNGILRGSLVHDGLYQFIRHGKLPATAREAADREFRAIVLEDGLALADRFSSFPPLAAARRALARARAEWVYRAVRHFGGPHASPAARRVIRVAPDL